MAEAAVLDERIEGGGPPPEPEAEPSEPKRGKGGRPPGRAVATTRWQRETPPEERAGFFEHTSGLSEVEWENHLLYVYMWAPIVDLTRGGVDKKNRKVYTRHMSEEDLKRDIGSGTYELRLNRIDPLTRKERTDRKIVVGILDYDFPPNIPPGQWMDDPRNADWLWAKPLLEKKYNIAKPNGAPVAGQPTFFEMLDYMDRRETRRQPRDDGPKEASIDKIIDSVSKAQQVALSTMAPKQEFSIIDVIKLIRETTPAPPPPPPPPVDKGIDPTLNLILTGLREDLKAARDEAKSERENSRKLMEKILEAKAEQVSPLAQIETLGNVIMKFGEITGKVSGPRDWKDGIVDAVTEVLPKAVELGSVYLTQKAALDKQKLAAAQAQNKPGAPAPATTAPALPPASTTAPPPATTAPPATDTATAAPAPDQPPVEEMDVNERTQIVYMATQAAQALNLGMKGDQFAEQICVLHGDRALEDFVAHFDKTKLIEKVKAVPEAWNVIAPHEARLPQFIEDFYSFAEAGPGEEDDPEPEPAPAAPAKKPAPKPAAKGKKK